MTKISLLILLMAAACNYPKKTNIDYLVTVNDFCLGAPDESTFAQLNEITKDGHCKGIQELVLADKVFALERGDTVQVIEAGTDKTRIKNMNDTFWVESKYLTSNISYE